jgi:hypothetical protein
LFVVAQNWLVFKEKTMANEPGKGQHEQDKNKHEQDKGHHEQNKGQREQAKRGQPVPAHSAPVQRIVHVQTEQGPESQDEHRKGVQQEAGKGAQHKEKAGHGGR